MLEKVAAFEEELSETERQLIKIGDETLLTAPHGYVEAYIGEIAPHLDPLTKKIKVTIRPKEQTKKLTLGSTVRIKLNITDGNGFMLPLAAIKFSGDQAFVLTIEENTTQSLPVTLGNSMGGMIYVLDGITGDTPVVADARGIQEDEKIAISESTKTE